MLSYREYKRPQSLEEAYELNKKMSNLVLAGTLWSRMSRSVKATGIDLCDLGLDYILEEENEFRIGAYTSLEKLGSHAGLDGYTRGAAHEAVRHIVGVQFRNMATVGGSIWGRFGFSDVLTLFLALDAKVVLYKRGEMPLSEFMKLSRRERDILTEIRVPKTTDDIFYASRRNQQTDLPVLTCAVARKGNTYTAVVGARPMIAAAVAIPESMKEPSEAAQYVSENLTFGSNVRAGAAYRKAQCTVLVEEAVKTLQGREE